MRTGMAATGVALAGLLLAGCGGAAPAAAPAAPASVVPAPPTDDTPRPEVIRLEGRDPCALLTASQRAALGLESPLIPSRALAFGDAPTCNTGSIERAVSAHWVLAANDSITGFTEGTKFDTELTPTKIRGFPAYISRVPGHPEFCNVDIDVAPGQLIDVEYADGGRKPPVPQQRLCAGAVDVADALLTTLLAD